MATSIARSDTAQPAAPPARRGAKRAARPAAPPETQYEPQSTTSPAAPSVEDQGDWVWLSQFTSTDWEHMICYLWRVEPITDRRQGGKSTSICKITRPFDMDDVMKAYGSGMYRADICKIAVTGNTQNRIRQIYFTILNMDYPPRVPFGEWVDDPINAQWKWAGSKIKAAEDTATAAATAGNGNGNTHGDGVNEMFNTVLNGIRVIQGEKDGNEGLAAQVVDLLRDQRDQITALMNPTTQFETLQRLLQLVKPNETKASGIETMLVTFMQDQLKAQRDEIRELRKAMTEQPQPKSLLDQIKELREAMSIFKGGGAPAGTDWGQVVTGVFDKLADHMPAIMMMLTQRQPPPGAPIWPGPNAAPAIRTAPPPASQPTHPQPAQPSPPAPGQPTNPSPGAAAAPAGDASYTNDELEQEKKILTNILVKHGALIQKCVPFMCDMFAAAMTGYDFRDWFIAREGQLKWAEVRADIGAERLAALVEMHPVLRETIKPREDAIRFFGEFCTAQGDEPADVENVDDEPDEEAQPAKPRRAKPPVQ